MVGLGFLIALAILVGLISVLLIVISLSSMSPGFKRVCIVVLGDIGHSPRMQYHALSFAKRGWHVDFVGYGGSRPHPDVVSNENIHCITMAEPPSFLKYFPRILIYILKVLWQSLTLSLAILKTKKAFHIFVQNPPAIPTLAIAWFMCVIRGSQLVIDWHNYGYTILAMAAGNHHPLVRFSKWYEKIFGRLSDANICVTEAMAEDLKHNWDISAVTVYDRPPAIFKETELEEQHHLFLRLADEYPVFASSGATYDVEYTLFTQKSPTGKITYREDRPALVVSSTSWTEDEDFSVLLAALEKYNQQSQVKSSLPKILCVITGKGPQKEYYMSLIKQRNLSNVQFCTPWLAAEDYPLLLGSADLGVCLHTSSSGLDLPMKVVDMFGCGLPVCAVNFNCLGELVKHEQNGLIFNSGDELSQQMQDLLSGFPKQQAELQSYRKNLKVFQKRRWEDCWEETVRPIFQLT